MGVNEGIIEKQLKEIVLRIELRIWPLRIVKKAVERDCVGV